MPISRHDSLGVSPQMRGHLEEPCKMLISPRLRYRRLQTTDLDRFHVLVVDEHIRHFLLDGELMDREWCLEQIAASNRLFESQGIGLWLVHLEDATAPPIGFCGYIRFAVTGPEPQLLYALRKEYTGQGYATEIATALIEFTRRSTRFTMIHSGVDEPNVASARVLEKVGFQCVGATPGAFGRIFKYTFALQPTNAPDRNPKGPPDA